MINGIAVAYPHSKTLQDLDKNLRVGLLFDDGGMLVCLGSESDRGIYNQDEMEDREWEHLCDK